MKLNVIIASHVVYVSEKKEVHGSAHLLHEYFTAKGFTTLFVKHSLFPSFPTVVQKGNKQYEINYSKNLFFPINFIWEIFYNIFFMLKYNNSKTAIYIGVDPLNAFAGLVAKKLKLIKAFIFYTPDYTEKRHKNILVNNLYHFIDELSIKSADQVWCASKRILEIRKKQGVQKDKLFYIPNMPQQSIIRSINPVREKFSLICVSNVDDNLGLLLVTEALAELQKENVMLEALYIIPGKLMDKISNQVHLLHLEKKITILGVQLYENVISYIKSSKIGIAMYDGSLGNNTFGDSLKIREYLACGIPVIITNIPANAEEIKQGNAGKIIRFSKNEFKNAIKEILENYEIYKKNAEKLGKTMNFDNFIEKPLQKLFYRI